MTYSSKASTLADCNAANGTHEGTRPNPGITCKSQKHRLHLPLISTNKANGVYYQSFDSAITTPNVPRSQKSGKMGNY